MSTRTNERPTLQNVEEDGVQPTLAALCKAQQTTWLADTAIPDWARIKPERSYDQRSRIHVFHNRDVKNEHPYSLDVDTDIATYTKVADMMARIHELLGTVGSDGPEFSVQSFNGLEMTIWACENAIRQQLTNINRYHEGIRNEPRQAGATPCER